MKRIKHIFLLTCGCLLISCSGSSNKDQNEIKRGDTAVNKGAEQVIDQVKKNPYENAKIEVKIIDNTKSENSEPKISGFGYDILMDGTLFIHQPNIPAVPGNNGFKNENDAKKVAELMIYKIKNNIVPPTITIEEMDSLGVLK